MKRLGGGRAFMADFWQNYRDSAAASGLNAIAPDRFQFPLLADICKLEKST